MSALATSERDWPEDFPHENGCYVCRCHGCEQHFFGYKRRVTCRLCSAKPPTMTTDTLAAEGRRLLEAATKPDRKVFWRCFHCNETFTKAQERWAREHFGDDEGERPVCQMRLPGEHHLLTALRKAQRELRRYRSEDTDLMRAIYAMRSDHAAALRSEEERGYNKGVADMTAEAERLRQALDAVKAWDMMDERFPHELAMQVRAALKEGGQ